MNTLQKDKKEYARRINTPDSMALYGNRRAGPGHAHQGQGSTVEHNNHHRHEPRGETYTSSNRDLATDRTTQDLSESSTTESESETMPMPMPVSKKLALGFFYKLTTLTYPLQAKAEVGKHE
jgi:hypothetical protein